MAIISSNNANITILSPSIPGGALKIENFDPESDMLTFDDLQSADAEMTPDGIINVWSLNNTISCTLNLSGGAWESCAKALALVINNQKRIGESISIVKNITMIIDYGNGETRTLPNGIMTTGKPAPSLGNQKITPSAWQFKFGGVL